VNDFIGSLILYIAKEKEAKCDSMHGCSEARNFFHGKYPKAALHKRFHFFISEVQEIYKICIYINIYIVE
jgi:hypothetical protein